MNCKVTLYYDKRHIHISFQHIPAGCIYGYGTDPRELPEKYREDEKGNKGGLRIRGTHRYEMVPARDNPEHGMENRDTGGSVQVLWNIERCLKL